MIHTYAAGMLTLLHAYAIVDTFATGYDNIGHWMSRPAVTAMARYAATRRVQRRRRRCQGDDTANERLPQAAEGVKRQDGLMLHMKVDTPPHAATLGCYISRCHCHIIA